MNVLARSIVIAVLAVTSLHAQTPDPRSDRFKAEISRAIDARAKMAQEMVDQVFSFGELGMQETETSRYLSGILEKNGFAVQRGVAGIPAAWVTKWSSGSPVISLGSDRQHFTKRWLLVRGDMARGTTAALPSTFWRRSR